VSADGQARVLGEATVAAIQASIESGVPYVGLRNLAVDPTLLHYVPLSVALEHWVVPLYVNDHALTVASPGPDPNLAPIARRFPNLSIEIVLATKAELAELLGRYEAAAAALLGTGTERGPR
jgi:hypothetical protein